MIKEASSFFTIAALLLILCVGYIYSQGGSPFALAGGHLTTSAQPPAPGDYHALARQDALDNGIDPTLFERQINQESGWNPDAVSRMGAIGIAQIMPDTATGWHVDPHDPVASLSAAAKAMAWYQTHYGSFEKALACYNAGTDALDRAMAQYGADWRIGLPAETRTYIRAIVGY
jgi:soluble lytic murein transglycosylase-like protein